MKGELYRGHILEHDSRLRQRDLETCPMLPVTRTSLPAAMGPRSRSGWGGPGGLPGSPSRVRAAPSAGTRRAWGRGRSKGYPPHGSGA